MVLTSFTFRPISSEKQYGTYAIVTHLSSSTPTTQLVSRTFFQSHHTAIMATTADEQDLTRNLIYCLLFTVIMIAALDFLSRRLVSTTMSASCQCETRIEQKLLDHENRLSIQMSRLRRKLATVEARLDAETQ